MAVDSQEQSGEIGTICPIGLPWLIRGERERTPSSPAAVSLLAVSQMAPVETLRAD